MTKPAPRFAPRTTCILGLCLPLALQLAACAPGPAQLAKATAPASAFDEAAVLARTAPVAQGFQAALRAQLQAAMQDGGPASALAVCQHIAPALAVQYSQSSGAEVRRVAERNRNPSAALDADLAPHYAALAAQPLVDGQPATRVWVSGSGAQTRVNVLSAIPMQEPCGVCHGIAVDPALQEQIDRLYPGDTATGFSPGELRGALLVSWRD